MEKEFWRTRPLTALSCSPKQKTAVSFSAALPSSSSVLAFLFSWRSFTQNYRHHLINIDHHPYDRVVVVSAVFGVFAGRLLQLGLFLHFLRGARLRSSANPRLCRSPLPGAPCRPPCALCRLPVPWTGCSSKWKTFPGAGAFHRTQLLLLCDPLSCHQHP